MKKNIAIVGATGLVGRTFLKVLEERNFPVNKLYLYASKRSAGKELEFLSKKYQVIELTEENIKDDIDIALFSAGASISEVYAPLFNKKGAIVIDNSSNFRMREDIPLVVPEVNPEKISDSMIIANPNCSTITVMPALKYLDDKYKIKRVVYSTYQSVSGAGNEALNDLERNLVGEKSTKFSTQIAFNLIPHIDKFDITGYTKEELKMINETRKILGKENLKVTATCVRVPVRYAHSVSCNVELENEFDLDELIKGLSEKEGVVVLNENKDNMYPMPLFIEGKDETYVGRIRKDESVENGLNLWIVADNIRKGAATNAIQIAEKLLNY
ncbi:aspartate-semialdehyde dehydrogenase [Oceanivirga miroungae]|uniref:Aspartate-semialdehyde dehydrogenase n=1 Tax=Oceanivirga miroungae TaxID=1130046 RepID=A0A6I8M9Q5_9FUSO|nr:aspartate-semialdehyde dehydrogenase [Oceanivirga miroungae]VWL85548.1 aspartate-semialdehyde dehydrogenase [Oceanivirga miroungae]